MNDDMRHAYTRDYLRAQGHTTHVEGVEFHYFLTPEQAQGLLPVAEQTPSSKKYKHVKKEPRIVQCPMCDEVFETKQYNRQYCSPPCQKEAQRRYFVEYNATEERKQYNADKQREGKVQTGWDEPLTELDKANLTDALIRACVAEMVQQYRTETRWAKKYAELFLMNYGKHYMEAVGEKVDFDYILNTIDKELGQ